MSRGSGGNQPNLPGPGEPGYGCLPTGRPRIHQAAARLIPGVIESVARERLGMSPNPNIPNNQQSNSLREFIIYAIRNFSRMDPNTNGLTPMNGRINNLDVMPVFERETWLSFFITSTTINSNRAIIDNRNSSELAVLMANIALICNILANKCKNRYNKNKRREALEAAQRRATASAGTGLPATTSTAHTPEGQPSSSTTGTGPIPEQPVQLEDILNEATMDLGDINWAEVIIQPRETVPDEPVLDNPIPDEPVPVEQGRGQGQGNIRWRPRTRQAFQLVDGVIESVARKRLGMHTNQNLPNNELSNTMRRFVGYAIGTCGANDPTTNGLTPSTSRFRTLDDLPDFDHSVWITFLLPDKTLDNILAVNDDPYSTPLEIEMANVSHVCHTLATKYSNRRDEIKRKETQDALQRRTTSATSTTNIADRQLLPSTSSQPTGARPIPEQQVQFRDILDEATFDLRDINWEGVPVPEPIPAQHVQVPEVPDESTLSQPVINWDEIFAPLENTGPVEPVPEPNILPGQDIAEPTMKSPPNDELVRQGVAELIDRLIEYIAAIRLSIPLPEVPSDGVTNILRHFIENAIEMDKMKRGKQKVTNRGKRPLSNSSDIMKIPLDHYFDQIWRYFLLGFDRRQELEDIFQLRFNPNIDPIVRESANLRLICHSLAARFEDNFKSPAPKRDSEQHERARKRLKPEGGSAQATTQQTDAAGNSTQQGDQFQDQEDQEYLDPLSDVNFEGEPDFQINLIDIEQPLLEDQPVEFPADNIWRAIQLAAQQFNGYQQTVDLPQDDPYRQFAYFALQNSNPIAVRQEMYDDIPDDDLPGTVEIAYEFTLDPYQIDQINQRLMDPNIGVQDSAYMITQLNCSYLAERILRGYFDAN